MNAPYDGDRDSAGQMPPSPEQRPSPPDPYLQNTYAYDPYRQQDPTAQDPVGEALHDRAAHPPTAAYGDQWQQQQQQSGYPHLPYGDNAATQYVGMDDLVGRAGQQPGQEQPYDAYEHLFRDQRQDGQAGQAADPRQGYAQPPQPQYPQNPQQYPRTRAATRSRAPPSSTTGISRATSSRTRSPPRTTRERATPSPPTTIRPTARPRTRTPSTSTAGYQDPRYNDPAGYADPRYGYPYQQPEPVPAGSPRTRNSSCLPHRT